MTRREIKEKEEGKIMSPIEFTKLLILNDKKLLQRKIKYSDFPGEERVK